MGVFNSNFRVNTNTTGTESSKSASSSKPNELVLARVIDVILDDTHPEYSKYGTTDALGVIKYKLLTSEANEFEPENLPSAFPVNASVRQLPLKNEVVFLVNGPANDLESSSINKRTYYLTTIALWNHPSHNAFPSDVNIDNLDLGDNIREIDYVQPLQPFPGDIIIDGRAGQSIRFSGYNSPKNLLGDLENQGRPITYIVNGRKGGGDDPVIPVVENINLDDSSIVLTSNHKVPLTQSATKYDTYITPPAFADLYRGKQVIINSGRLLFNSTEENIIMSAFTSVSMTAGRTINLDAETYIGMDAPIILIGTQRNINKELKTLREYRFREPVVLGNQLESFLSTLLDVLDEIAVALSSAQTKRGSPLPGLQEVGAATTTLINTLLKPRINPGKTSSLKSKKIFVE